MDPEGRRIAEVWTGAAVGSGYLVSPRHVLTALHLVRVNGGDRLIEACEIRCLGQLQWFQSKIRWSHDLLDLALLEIVDAAWTEPIVDPVRWGWVLGSRAVDCTAVGFPDAQRQASASRSTRDTEQLQGAIDPLTLSKTAKLGINLVRGVPTGRGTGRTWWSGMSGAAVFADGALVGVVVSVPQEFGGRRLNATPIARAVREFGLASILAEAGVDLHLESVPSVQGLRYPWQLVSSRGLGSPSLLLRADRAAVPFRGRQLEFEQLLAWCQDPASPVRLIVGRGGAGKTRLALELCRKLEEGDWTAAFLDDQGGATTIQRLQALGRPSLLVIDYAETRSDLARLLQPLKNASQDGAPMRVLLIARDGGDWWRELQGDSSVQELVIGESPRVLGAVAELVDDRHEAYQEAVVAFAAAQGMQLPDAPPPDLSVQNFREILYLHMAALDAVGTHAEPGRELSSRQRIPALTAILRREENYWARSASARSITYSRRVLARAIVMATLIGADTEQDAVELLRKVPELKDASNADRQELSWWQHFLYPGDEWTAPLEPDMLGEELIAAVLQESPQLVDSLFVDVGHGRTIRALTLLDRAVQRRPILVNVLERALKSDLDRLAPAAMTVAIQTGDPIGRLLSKAFEQSTDLSEEILKLESTIPHETIALREIGAHLTARLVERLRTAGSAPNLARALNNLSFRRGAVGQWDSALAAAQEALQIRRALSRDQPQAFLPQLANTLNTLSNCLTALGRHGEALFAIEEAVEIRRGRVGSQPDIALVELANALTTYSNGLSEVGRLEAALATSEEAVAIQRSLATRQPDAFLRQLAIALNNLGNRLTAVGRSELALLALEESVTHWGTLAKTQPDAYLPDLLRSLNNLSNCLSTLGRSEAGLVAMEEAAAGWRELAAARPEAFQHNLAMSLGGLSNRQAELGRLEQALATMEEAVLMWRSLAAAQPDSFLPEFAMSLNNLCNRLAALGRYESAISAADEAVTAYRGLAHESPDAFSKHLAMALNNLSNCQAELGLVDLALASIQQAVEVRRNLAARWPEAFLPDLAQSLINLAERLGKLGRKRPALIAIKEAVDIYRSRAEALPEAYLPALAMSLSNYSSHLAAGGRLDEARDAVVESVQIYRQLAAARRDAFAPGLALALSGLSARLGVIGDLEPALAASEEAVTIGRDLAETYPDAFRPRLAHFLTNLSVILSQVGDRDRAVDAISEAVGIYRALVEGRPQTFLPLLALSLNNLSNYLADLGFADRALDVIEEAVRIRRHLFRERPDTYASDLALSLRNLASRLASLGKEDRALATRQEAIRLQSSSEQVED